MSEPRDMRQGDPYSTGDESIKGLVSWLRQAIAGAEKAGQDTLMLAIPKTPIRVAELRALAGRLEASERIDAVERRSAELEAALEYAEEVARGVGEHVAGIALDGIPEDHPLHSDAGFLTKMKEYGRVIGEGIADAIAQRRAALAPAATQTPTQEMVGRAVKALYYVVYKLEYAVKEGLDNRNVHESLVLTRDAIKDLSEATQTQEPE